MKRVRSEGKLTGWVRINTVSIGNHAMLLVQLGINSTSDVWKFCQNWTSRRGESNLANFQTSRVLLIPNCTSNIA